MRALRDPVLRLVIAPFVVAKTVSLVVPLLVVWQGSATPGFPSWAEVRHAFEEWDAASYLQLAQHGYPTDAAGPSGYLYAFLPGYPMLVAATATILRDAVVSGIVVSAAAELVALYWIARLVIGERDVEAGRFSVWMVALWPFAFFLTAVYTESVFIAVAAAALYTGRRGRLVPACVLGAMSCLVRVTGLALLPFLVIEYLGRHRRRPDASVLAIALVPVPLLLFAVYSHLHAGDTLAYLHAQSSPSFNHTSAWPWNGARLTYEQVFNAQAPASHTYVFALELLFGFVGLAVCAAAFVHRRFPVSMAGYCAAVWLLATSISFWLSVPRYELAMFPLVIILADLLDRRPAWRGASVAGSAALMAYGAGRYAAGLWLG